MVMSMIWNGYALQQGFCDYLNQHPDVLSQLHEMSEEQQKQLVHLLNEEELRERAITYFNNENIYLKDHTLYYENTLRKTTYTMQVFPLHVTLSEKEGNPFLPFLQRIFRKFFICES